jgi:hypothetical protein
VSFVLPDRAAFFKIEFSAHLYEYIIIYLAVTANPRKTKEMGLLFLFNGVILSLQEIGGLALHRVQGELVEPRLP